MTVDQTVCAGPHLACRGCSGNGKVPGTTLYVGRGSRGSDLLAEHVCQACQGKGFFCQASPVCVGDHEETTPVINPGKLPPV
ncbi:hypothetical protein [Streptomyces sp. NPDC086787]|uniref:hypothetical protein n=1 Tax=Streptomyces sp. NPDC086787 TaxID=3365759 RepID=UPI0037FEEFCF